MNFLQGVQRILRLEGIIRGDDDAPTSFDDTQHAATVQLAILAVQEELTHLTANEMIPYESDTNTIVSVAGTRTYALQTDFIGFDDAPPFLVREDGSSNATTTLLPPYQGGESQLRKDFPQYREQQGNPTHFYLGTGTTKNIGLYMVPSEAITYRYYYQKSVRVTIVSDTLPFVAEEEAETFIKIAARRFKYMHATTDVQQALFPNGLERDQIIMSTRAVLMNLLGGIKKPRKYGRKFGVPVAQDGW